MSVERALQQAGDWPVDRVATGATDAEGTIATFGAVTDPFRWASVTKLMTALTTLMAVEQDLLSLDDPAGPEGSTVRHLLAHASGLPFEGDTPVADVEERRIYSNAGFLQLGSVLEDRLGIPYEELVGENVLDPLGMDATSVPGGPAAGAEGPLEDVLRLGRELLAPQLIGRERHEEATSVVFPGLPGVLPGFGRMEHNDWGLGFEIRDDKTPHWTGRDNSPATFGHFGGSGTFLWVDPEAGLACAALTDRSFDGWALERWPELSDAVLAAHGVV